MNKRKYQDDVNKVLPNPYYFSMNDYYIIDQSNICGRVACPERTWLDVRYTNNYINNGQSTMAIHQQLLLSAVYLRHARRFHVQRHSPSWFPFVLLHRLLRRTSNRRMLPHHCGRHARITTVFGEFGIGVRMGWMIFVKMVERDHSSEIAIYEGYRIRCVYSCKSGRGAYAADTHNR